jgi:hypothetical protein
MRSRNSQHGAILFLFLFLLILTPSAYAYLDPGTGSFIFQMLIAGLVGMSFALKLFWAQIKMFFMSLFSKNKKENDSEA